MIKRWLKHIAIEIYKAGKINEQTEIYQSFRKQFDIHESFRFNGDNILFYSFGTGKIICGEGSYIGSLSTIQAFDKCTVKIGKGCSISYNVRMYTQSSDADEDFSKKNIKEKTGDIIIGDFVWIGANVFINPGINIGNNSVIGANSVVSRDVEPYSIVGGVPAKLIRYKRL
ncbi:MAG TPA: acyltransferase [Puia sp.]|nr:acyltransferase [Puia sp.]